MELILVRHGETDSNIKKKFLGWTDVELNTNGINQAYCAAEKLSRLKVDSIFSSPLKRTRKTAEIINEKFNLGIKYCDSLKERNFGKWDDLSFDEIKACYPEEHKMWLSDPANYCIIGGESSIQTYSRIKGFIDELLQNKRNGIHVIVTHLGCIRMIAAYLIGMGIEGSWRFRVDNGSLTTFEINDEGYAYLTKLNG